MDRAQFLKEAADGAVGLELAMAADEYRGEFVQKSSPSAQSRRATFSPACQGDEAQPEDHLHKVPPCPPLMPSPEQAPWPYL